MFPLYHNIPFSSKGMQPMKSSNVGSRKEKSLMAWTQDGQREAKRGTEGGGSFGGRTRRHPSGIYGSEQIVWNKINSTLLIQTLEDSPLILAWLFKTVVHYKGYINYDIQVSYIQCQESLSHGTLTCIKRRNMYYGKFFDFNAQKCI